MKKFILSIILICGFFIVNAQKTTGPNYVFIGQRYEWFMGIFQALGLPAGPGPAAFLPGQEPRAGAMYYDSSGVDEGLYIWSGLAWNLQGAGEVTQSALDDTAATIRNDFPIYTASQGLYKSGNDIRLGAPIGSSSPLTDDRVIDIGYQKTLYFARNFVPVTPSNQGYPAIHTQVIDSMKANNEASSLLPTVATDWKRIIRVVGNYSSNFKLGHRQSLWYEFGDTARITSNGGDYGGAVFNTLYLTYLPSFTTGRASIRGGVADFEGTYAAMSNVEFPHSNASRHIRLHGWISAHHSYLRMINQPDTIDNFIFYQSLGFKEANARVLKAYNFYPNFVSADSSWSWFSKISDNRFYQEGSVTIGGGYTSSPYKFRVQGTGYFSDTLTALTVGTTDSSDIVATTKWVKQQAYGSGGGGSPSLTNTYVGVGDGSNLLSGSNQLVFSGGELRLGNADFGAFSLQTTGNAYVNGIFNSADYTVAQYYQMSGLASAPSTSNPAIYYNSVTDKYQSWNVGTSTWEDIAVGSGSGLTGSLTATRVPFATGASTLSDDASMTWDDTNKKMLIGNGTTTNGIITINGGNQSGTSSQFIIQQSGTSGLHLGTGNTGAYVRAANNKKLQLQANGTSDIEHTVSAGRTHIFLNGNVSLQTVGTKLQIATGSNASIGTATLVAGTVTVNTTAVATGSKIFVTVNTPGGTQGFLSVPDASITNGTSFIINSTSATETSTVNYWIIN